MTSKIKYIKFVCISSIIILQVLFSRVTNNQEVLELPITGRIAKYDVSSKLSVSLDTITVTKVSVPGLFSYSVQQTGNNVPDQSNVVGQYSQAKQNNSIGLIAHNYLAGSSFKWVSYGDEIQVTSSNGNVEHFVVTKIMQFQATDPNDYGKPFIDRNSGETISTKEVFNRAYRPGMVTLQTCIAGTGTMTWGILIVQAVPGFGKVYSAPISVEITQDEIIAFTGPVFEKVFPGGTEKDYAKLNVFSWENK